MTINFLSSKLSVILFYICLPLSLFAQEILHEEDTRFEAQIKQDISVLAEMLSDDLLFIHSNAFIEDKAAFLENVKNATVIYSRMKAEEGRQVLMHKKTALVRGILQVAGTYQSKEFDIRVRYTAIYRKSKKKWQLLNWQSTKIPE